MMTIFETWKAALTQPREETYARIAAQPEVSSSKAFLYVFIGSLLSAFFLFIGQLVFAGAHGRGMLDGWGNSSLGMIGVMLLCGIPVFAVVGVLSFGIFVGLTNWTARLFGGVGNFDQLAYTLAAVTVPAAIISGALNMFSGVPVLGFLVGTIGFGISIYILYLEVLAVKAVHGVSTGKALGAIFLPGLAIAFVVGCFVLAFLAVMGPAIANMFEQMMQQVY